jgi:hypothetical protein
MRRVLAWALTLPLTAAGVLCAHALAYASLGVPGGATHAYLGHLPQLVAVFATIALAALALETRGAARPAWPFAAFALAAFAAQEHVEHLVHAGELPWLLTSPVFLLGLALQLPFALAAWLLARRLLLLRAQPRPRPPGLPALLLPVPDAPPHLASPAWAVRHRGRGPPVTS